MKQQRRGKIVNISSGTVFYGAPLVAHYVTSKAGVIGLTRSLARELGEYNINVNAIAPGLTMSMEEVSEARAAQNQQRLQARAIKRTEMPQDLVGTVVFLCSPDSDFMTGQTLVVDGGAQMPSGITLSLSPILRGVSRLHWAARLRPLGGAATARWGVATRRKWHVYFLTTVRAVQAVAGI